MREEGEGTSWAPQGTAPSEGSLSEGHTSYYEGSEQSWHTSHDYDPPTITYPTPEVCHMILMQVQEDRRSLGSTLLVVRA